MNKKTLLEIFAVAGIFCLAGFEKKAYAQSSNQVAKIPSAEKLLRSVITLCIMQALFIYNSRLLLRQ